MLVIKTCLMFSMVSWLLVTMSRPCWLKTCVNHKWKSACDFFPLNQDILKQTEKAGEDTKDLQRAVEVMHVVPKAANDMMNVGRLQGFEVSSNIRTLLSHSTLHNQMQTSGNLWFFDMIFNWFFFFLHWNLTAECHLMCSNLTNEINTHYITC